MSSRMRFTIFNFAVLMCASIASAQGLLGIDANDYGTSSVNYLIIPGAEFITSDSATGYNKPFLFLERTGGGGSEFTHALNLPSGAVVQTIQANVTDSSAASDITLRLCKMTALPDGTAQNIYCDGFYGTPTPVSTTGTPGATGLIMNVNDTFLPYDPSSGWDVSWVILVHLETTDGSHALHGVKVTWKRQISPDPATATFTDVPVGHPFHRFVEALVAAGITGGCGGGKYCPDAPITRGQMAVFLSAALGLHWAP